MLNDLEINALVFYMLIAALSLSMWSLVCGLNLKYFYATDNGGDFHKGVEERDKSIFNLLYT